MDSFTCTEDRPLHRGRFHLLCFGCLVQPLLLKYEKLPACNCDAEKPPTPNPPAATGKPPGV